MKNKAKTSGIYRLRPAGLAGIALLLAAATPGAFADVVSAVTLADFPAGSPVVTFDDQTAGGNADGTTDGGITFHYPNGGLVYDGGPGTTNDITPPNLVSTGDPTGTLTMNLSAPVNMLGFGWAVLASGPIPDALTISVLNGNTLLGSLDFGGDGSPTFTGGFAGIQSTQDFDEVEVTFAQSGAPAFALDNIITAEVAATPEPASVFQLLGGLGVLALAARKKLSQRN
jgi:hypothetical protein